MSITIQSDIRAIALHDATGVKFHYPILPNQWKGQLDCIVGPFSGKHVAEYFANYAVEYRQYQQVTYRVFPKRNEWYVEVKSLIMAPAATR